MPVEAPMMAGEEPAATAPPPEQEQPVEATSVFIPKEVLGEKEYAVGDTITLTVKDIDQDTGEIEAVANQSETAPPRSRLNEAIDQMPEGEEY